MERNARGRVGIRSEVLQDVDKVTRILGVESGLQIGGALGAAESQAIEGHAAGRAVDEGEKARNPAFLGGAEEPALTGLTRPVIAAFGDLEGLRGSPWFGNLRIDSAADVEAPAGEADSFGPREQQIGDTRTAVRRPRAELLHAPAVRGPKVVDLLVFDIQVNGVPVRRRCISGFECVAGGAHGEGLQNRAA